MLGLIILILVGAFFVTLLVVQHQNKQRDMLRLDLDPQGGTPEQSPSLSVVPDTDEVDEDDDKYTYTDKPSSNITF